MVTVPGDLKDRPVARTSRQQDSSAGSRVDGWFVIALLAACVIGLIIVVMGMLAV
jgi:hypothetical protein